MEDVIISMQSVQNFDDEEDASTLDFMTDGQYSFDHDIGCLTYEESEVFGLPGTKTSDFIMPDRVVVDRYGSLTSRMVFKEGEKTVFPFPSVKLLKGILAHLWRVRVWTNPLCKTECWNTRKTPAANRPKDFSTPATVCT